jgi:hypothetical protein
MSRHTGTAQIRALAAIRAGWAGALLFAPERLLGVAGRAPVPPAAVATIRVLGVRHLLQAAASAAAPNASVMGAGAVVDALHTGTCVGLAALSPHWRRVALLDAAIETLFAASGWIGGSRARRTR